MKTYTFLMIPFMILGMTLNVANAQKKPNVDQMIKEMTIDEKLGQLILLGFRGMSIKDSPEIKKAIKEQHIGSVILFDYDVVLKQRKRNIQSPKQVQKLVKELQKESKIPLFISIDEEGGKVSRLKAQYGFKAKPAPEALAKLPLRDVQKSAEVLAQELKELGINVNFAPLADVNTNPRNPVIGSLGRSFSSDPYKVADYCEAFMKGQSNKNVISVIKHFPGHGSSENDSHLGLVDVSDTWSERELIPFQELINKKKVQMIMSAHIFNRHLDDKYPATLSKKTITDLLRKELNYDGVIISDDMDMGAIKDHYGLKEAIELAINAGIDILLFGNNLNYDKDLGPKVHNILKQLYSEGKLTEERLNQSLKRILSLKNLK